MFYYFSDETIGYIEPSDQLLQLGFGLLVTGASYLHLFQQQHQPIDKTKLTITGCVSAALVQVAANLSFNTYQLEYLNFSIIFGYGTPFCLQQVFWFFFAYAFDFIRESVWSVMLILLTLGLLILAELAVGHAANWIYKQFWSHFASAHKDNEDQ